MQVQSLRTWARQQLQQLVTSGVQVMRMPVQVYWWDQTLRQPSDGGGGGSSAAALGVWLPGSITGIDTLAGTVTVSACICMCSML